MEVAQTDRPTDRPRSPGRRPLRRRRKRTEPGPRRGADSLGAPLPPPPSRPHRPLFPGAAPRPRPPPSLGEDPAAFPSAPATGGVGREETLPPPLSAPCGPALPGCWRSGGTGSCREGSGAGPGGAGQTRGRAAALLHPRLAAVGRGCR